MHKERELANGAEVCCVPCCAWCCVVEMWCSIVVLCGLGDGVLLCGFCADAVCSVVVLCCGALLWLRCAAVQGSVWLGKLEGRLGVVVIKISHMQEEPESPIWEEAEAVALSPLSTPTTRHTQH